MIWKDLPGYKELFDDEGKSYEEWLKDIPSEVVINIFIAFNNELDAPEAAADIQLRLRELAYEGLSIQEVDLLNHAYFRYYLNNSYYDGFLFGRRYILELLTREFKRNKKCEVRKINLNLNFSIFMAYLQVVEEMNERDAQRNIEIFKDSSSKNQFLTWPAFIDQYEFNHDSLLLFEEFKLLCFCKYSVEHLRDSLKEYLLKFNFRSISQFFKSYNEIAGTTLTYKEVKDFRKLNYMQPLPNIDISHLKGLSINNKLGSADVTLDTIRKYPIFQTNNNLFVIINNNFLLKKMYTGTFFEMLYKTSYKKEERKKDGNKVFEEYSSLIAKEVMEKLCFRTICKFLMSSDKELYHFDDSNGNQSEPDLYLRENRRIIIIEFKDYSFQDKLTEKPDFNTIENFIIKKFIQSKGSPKGITQLQNQIDLLYKKKYTFDTGLNTLIGSEETFTIYPILCYTNFMFGMSGTNKYLNDLFKENIKRKEYHNLIVKPVTLINLEILFDFCYCQGDFNSLTILIEDYWNKIENCSKDFQKTSSTDDLFESLASFDEVYNTIYIEGLKGKIRRGLFSDLINYIDLTEEQMVAAL